MWFKLIGAGLLLCCGGLWVRAQTRDERAALARVSALCELFSRIGEQIEALCLPLDEILASTSQALVEDCGLDGSRPISSLSHVAQEIGDPAAAEAISRAAAQLGRGSREDQVRLCRATVQSLSSCRDRMAGETERNARARGTLVLTACLCGIILLW